MASFRSHVQTKELDESGEGSAMLHNSRYDDNISKLFPVNESSTVSPVSTRSYGETQLEIFYHRHGLLILHFLGALMFVPSLVAWFQLPIELEQYDRIEQLKKSGVGKMSMGIEYSVGDHILISGNIEDVISIEA